MKTEPERSSDEPFKSNFTFGSVTSGLLFENTTFFFLSHLTTVKKTCRHCYVEMGCPAGNTSDTRTDWKRHQRSR